MAAERDQGECEQRFRLAAGATARPEGKRESFRQALGVRDWPVMWRKSCRRQRCRPDDLRLEVTESSLMSNADAALESMQDLQTRWA
jgi:hypothetical protein